ncbi:hypothetical protein Ahy_A10g050393 [Arachis hypogaea]|uniref:Oxo-4-hydroxy-4-carboxy-5-ureidoimidazoline decarboxylase domain-containing protein n=1 Tax=Arachis hypogaea TaxID=3818 RepID=A0A445B9B8_ARAHY|nr:hypothetical protein Ahy_A10g050393 [Arachis hypogaea]
MHLKVSTSITELPKIEDFSSCYASTTFAKEMAIVSPFSSLEHAISIAREIWFRKVNVRDALVSINTWKWLMKLSCRNFMNGDQCTRRNWDVFVTCASEKSSEDILAELKMRFTNKHEVELGIASQEEMKFIELHITELLSKKSAKTINKEDVLAKYSDEIVNNSLGGEEIDSVSEENNKTLDDQQGEDDVHVAKSGFNMNKKPWFGDDISGPLSRKATRFVTEYFWPNQYDVEEKN